MVAVGFVGGIVFAEALRLLVVIVADGLAFPVLVALDPEVVVGFAGEGAVAVAGFEAALGQRDAGRDAGGFHFLDGNGRILRNVLGAREFLPGCGAEAGEQQRAHDRQPWNHQ